MSLGFPLFLLKLSAKEAACCEQILSGTGGGWIARHINKRISMPASIYLARWGVTPNHITLVNLILGILAGVVASFGGYANLLAGGLLFQAVSIIDGCDGEVAKLNDRATRFGAWFDTVGDNLSFVIFIVGVTLGLYRETQALWIVYAAELTLVSFVLLLSIMISYLVQKKSDKASLVTYEQEVWGKTLDEEKNLWGAFLRYGRFLVKKDFFAFLFFALAVVNLPQAIVFFSALGSTAVALILSGMVIQKWRLKRVTNTGEVLGS